MKILKSRRGLLWFFTGLFIIVSMASLLLAPHSIIQLGYLNWVFVAACLWQFFQAEDSAPSVSLKIPFLKISLFQFSFIAIFYGICKISGSWLANYTAPQPELFVSTLRLLWWHFGLFPWPAIAIFTAIFSKLLRSGDSYPHMLLPKYFKAAADNRWGLLINAATRMAITLLLSLMIGFSALGLLYLAAPNMTRDLLGFQPIILILLLALFAFFASKSAENYWRQLHSYVLFTPFIVFPALIILLTLILFVFLAAAVSFASDAAPKVHLISLLANAGWLNYWLVFAFCFWILSIIPMSLWMASSTQALSTRKVIALVLFWPLIFSLISAAKWHLGENSAVDSVILFGAALLLSALLAARANWQGTARGYLEKDLVKKRPATRLLRNVSMITLLLIYLFWQSSVIGLSFVSWLVALPLFLVLLLSAFTH